MTLFSYWRSQLPLLYNQQLKVYHIYTTIYTQKTWMIRWLAYRQVGDLALLICTAFHSENRFSYSLFWPNKQQSRSLCAFNTNGCCSQLFSIHNSFFWLNNITCVIQVCLHQEKNSVSLCQESAYQSNTQQPGVQTCAVECKNIFIQYVLNHRQCNSELNLWPLTSLTTKRKSLFCTPKR